MIFSNRLAGYTRAFRQGPGQRISAALRYCWDAYSKPVPETIWEGLTLLGLCSLVSLVTGGFLFHWMSEVLRYGQTLAATVAGLYGAVAFFFLFLVHPLRCILTLVMPTLGTKQGRKLIISTSLMLLALNVVPNIASNVGVMAHILKCTGSGLAQSLINSSEVLNIAREDLINEVQEVRPSFVPTLTEFHHDTYINVSEVKQRFVDISQHIENDFAQAKRIMDEIKLLANRLIASIFVIYLLVEAALYLNGFLTDMKFDNIYITGQLQHMARENEVEIFPDDAKNMVYSTSYKISKQEFLKCVLRLAGVSLYFVITVFIVGMDHAVFHLVKKSEPWLLDLPSMSMSITVNYKMQYYTDIACLLLPTCSRTDMVNFKREYAWDFGFVSEHCTRRASEPDAWVVISLGLLYLLAYTTVLLEVYVRRARRKVSASFFPWQERRRTEFIFKKILTRKEKQRGGIFFIETRHGGDFCNTADSSHT